VTVVRHLPLVLVIGALACGSTPVPDGTEPDDAAVTRDARAFGEPEASTDDEDAGADSPSSPGADLDGDGIPDATEAMYADAYMPFISVHPTDNCPTRGIVYRVSPHPNEPKRVMMWVDVLYDQDCGAGGHSGDDEVFGVVIDPSKPAPEGILAIRAISHQNTPCQHITTCGSCAGLKACGTGTRDGKAYPVVYPSKDKHGNYAELGVCATSFLCDTSGCALSAPDTSPRVNAGEPAQPLVHDLSTQGFVNEANGWTQTGLFHYDPWKPGKFGSAGEVSKDLVDTGFVVDTTTCP
jgi:hypothetical protein